MHNACSFYLNADEQLLVAVPFIDEGLLHGERCIVVSDDTETWQRAYPGAAVTEDAAGAGVSLWPSVSWQPPGKFNSLAMAKHVWSAIEDALASSSGVRFVVDMAWTQSSQVLSSAVCHWEATLDALITADTPVRVLCQYSRSSLPVATLHAGLRTHPFVHTGEHAVANPHYEAEAILENEPLLNECSSDPELVGRLLAPFLSNG